MGVVSVLQGMYVISKIVVRDQDRQTDRQTDIDT